MNKEIFLSLTLEDLNSYFSTSILRVRENKNSHWKWGRLNLPNPFVKTLNKNCISILFKKTETESKEKNFPIDEMELDFEFPKSGIYNFKDRVIWFAKSGTRTLKLGICQDTVFCSSPLAIFASYEIIPKELWNKNKFVFGIHDFTLMFEKISSIPFEKALTSILKSQAFGRNLDGRFWISCGIFSKNPTIWMLDRPIGELDVDKTKIMPFLEIYESELQSLFEPHGFSI